MRWCRYAFLAVMLSGPGCSIVVSDSPPQTDAATGDLCDELLDGWTFCDGFESPAFDGWNSVTGPAIVDETTFFSGTGSALFRSVDDERVWATTDFRTDGQVTRVSFRMKLGADADFERVAIMRLSADASLRNLQIQLETDRNLRIIDADGMVTSSSPGVVLADTWHCFEFQYDLGRNDIALLVDGTRATSSSSGPLSELDVLDVGLIFPTTGDTSLHVDDVVISSDAPSGCR